MAYSINPNLPKARATALQMLIRDQLPLGVVANKCGVHRSTIWRWKRKWDVLTHYLCNISAGVRICIPKCTLWWL